MPLLLEMSEALGRAATASYVSGELQMSKPEFDHYMDGAARVGKFLAEIEAEGMPVENIYRITRQYTTMFEHLLITLPRTS